MVENHEAGLLFVEGRLVERLAPGRHAFWMAGRKIEVKLRPQAVEITAPGDADQLTSKATGLRRRRREARLDATRGAPAGRTTSAIVTGRAAPGFKG